MLLSPGCTLVALGLLVACESSGMPVPEYEPTPGALVGEFSGSAGSDFETYNLFLAVDQVGDSVRGVWSLSFPATCSTHDGPFSGSLEGAELRIRLRPDEGYEATLELLAQVLPGDSVLTGNLSLVAAGDVGEGPALCGSDQLAPITLHYGEVDGLPLGR